MWHELIETIFPVRKKVNVRERISRSVWLGLNASIFNQQSRKETAIRVFNINQISWWKTTGACVSHHQNKEVPAHDEALKMMLRWMRVEERNPAYEHVNTDD